MNPMFGVVECRQLLPTDKVPASRWYWAGIATLSALLLLADYLTGPLIRFPIAFVLPVAMASWYFGMLPGVLIAITLVALQLVQMYFIVVTPESPPAALVNALIRAAVLIAIAYLVSRNHSLQRQLQARIAALEGIVPICSFCKKIHVQDKEWLPIEQYLSARVDAQFSHGLCDECSRKHYADTWQDNSAVST